MNQQNGRHPRPADPVVIVGGSCDGAAGFVAALGGNDAVVGLDVVGGRLREIRVPIRNLRVRSVGSGHWQRRES